MWCVFARLCAVFVLWCSVWVRLVCCVCDVLVWLCGCDWCLCRVVMDCVCVVVVVVCGCVCRCGGLRCVYGVVCCALMGLSQYGVLLWCVVRVRVWCGVVGVVFCGVRGVCGVMCCFVVVC